jgi:cullin-associated NEDD8-dissociated protein 1
MSGNKLKELLTKTSHFDPDERYMATSDLIAQLSGESRIEPSLQVPVCNAIIKQLDDKSADVQTVAVKCLSVLVKKFDNAQVVTIAQKLGSLVIDQSQDQSRDVYSIGVRTVVSSIDSAGNAEVCNILMTCMITGLSSTVPNIQDVCLDISKDVLLRFGWSLTSIHDVVLKAVTPLLEAKQDTTRKRAVATIGALVTVLRDDALDNFVTAVLVRKMQETKNQPIIFTLLQTISTISRCAGRRIGRYLDVIIPRLNSYCHIDPNAGPASEQLIELWENCLQAYSAMLVRCPLEMAAYSSAVLGLAIAFLSYDPNYIYATPATVPMDEGEEAWGGDEIGEDGWGADDAQVRPASASPRIDPESP